MVMVDEKSRPSLFLWERGGGGDHMGDDPVKVFFDYVGPLLVVSTSRLAEV